MCSNFSGVEKLGCFYAGYRPTDQHYYNQILKVEAMDLTDIRDGNFTIVYGFVERTIDKRQRRSFVYSTVQNV